MLIADSTRSESISMTTISIVTLIYLPATAIGTIFGMPFFENTGEETGDLQIQLSRDFWMFWVITIPLTLITLVAWYFWQRSFLKAKKLQAEADDAVETRPEKLQSVRSGSGSTASLRDSRIGSQFCGSRYEKVKASTYGWLRGIKGRLRLKKSKVDDSTV